MALEFNEMSKQGQWGTVGCICVAFVAVFYFYVWAPTAEESTALEIEIQEMQLENNRTRLIAGRLPQLEAELELMEVQLTTLSNILPDEQQAVPLLGALQRSAADVNLEIRRFDQQGVILHDFYAEVPIQLDLVGRYHDLALFFDRVAKFGPIVTVGEVSIRALQQSNGIDTIEAQCTASTFYFLPESVVTDPDAVGATGG